MQLLTTNLQIRGSLLFLGLAIFYGFPSAMLGASDLFMIYVGLIILYIFSPQNKLNLNLPFVIAFALLGVVGIAASALSKFPDISFQRLSLYRDLIFLGVAFYILFQDSLCTSAKWILLSIILAFLALTPLTLLEYFRYSADQTVSGQRYIAPELSYYGHIRHYSYHAFIASCCATLLVWNHHVDKRLGWALLLACVIALILSSGRGALLSYAIFVVFLLRPQIGTLKLLKLLLIGTALTLVVLLALWVSPFGSITTSLVERTMQPGGIDQILSGRIGFWERALVSVSETPLLGLGPEGYRWSDGVLPHIRQPHNSIVQFIVEFGYFGAAVIAGTIFKLASPTFRAQEFATLEQKNLHRGLSVFLFAFFCYSLVDGLFYHLMPLLHLAFIVPIWYSLPVDRKIPTT